VLKKALAEGVTEDAEPDSACPAPVWQRGPMRLSFVGSSRGEGNVCRGHIVDVVNDAEEDDE